MIKISIASTFYNDKEMLKRVMDSVLSQTYQNIEHCIADGGSTDGSVELLKEYEQKYHDSGKTLRWISEKDDGLYHGFNKAANLVSGEYFIFGTDPYVNNKVFDYIASFLEGKKPDYVFGGMLFQRNGKIIRLWNGKKGNWKLGWMAATPTLCMKRELWDKYGPMDCKFSSASDYKFQIMLFKDKSLTSYSLERKIVIYYAGGTSNGGLGGKLLSIRECQNILKECNVKCGWFVNLCKITRALFAYSFASHKKIVLEEEI